MPVEEASGIQGAEIRRLTYWKPGERPEEGERGSRGDNSVIWLDLVGDPDAAESLFEQLAPLCPGLTVEMLRDLLDPDEEPRGSTYADGKIRLASTFGVETRVLGSKVERGHAQGAGVLIFQPVELLASDTWLLTCWHPTRPFSGAEQAPPGPPGSSDEVFRSVAERWRTSTSHRGGDLGLMVMHELSVTYRAATWALQGWHQNWELSLYVDDDVSNPDELPRLWGAMAVLRDWLSALNRPGLRVDPEKAWLPVTDLKVVVDVDDRIDKTLSELAKLAATMRASFSVLHVQMAEGDRERKESFQHRIELIGAILLIPTLVVGFYGANTWVPGEQQHWGFWVMLAVLLTFTTAAVLLLRRWRQAQTEEARLLKEERLQAHIELLASLDA